MRRRTPSPYQPKPFTPGAAITWQECRDGVMHTRHGQVWSLTQPYGGRAALWAIPDDGREAAVVLTYRKRDNQVLGISCTMPHTTLNLTIRRANALSSTPTVVLTHPGPRKNRLIDPPRTWGSRPVEVHLPDCPEIDNHDQVDQSGTRHARPYLAHVLDQPIAGTPPAREATYCPHCLGTPAAADLTHAA